MHESHKFVKGQSAIINQINFENQDKKIKIAIPADIFFEMVLMCGRQFKDSSILTPRDLCVNREL